MEKAKPSFIPFLLLSIITSYLLSVWLPPRHGLIRPHVFVSARHIKDDQASFYTKIKVNGVDIGDAVIDTGATDTTISIHNANRAHINWRKGKITDYIMANNSINTCSVVRAKITVGSISHIAPISVCPHADSLLGMTFVAKTKLHIEKNVMTIN